MSKKIMPFVLIVDVIVIIFIAISIINKNQLKEYKYKHFIYNIPNSINFSSDENYMYMKKRHLWDVSIDVMILDYEFLSKNVNSLQNALGTFGYIVSGIKNITVNNVNLLVCESTYDNKNVLIAYVYDSEYDYVYEIELYNSDGSFDYSPLNDVISVVMNATYDDSDDSKYKFNYLNLKDYV